MVNDHSHRISTYRGTPHQVGLAAGKALGARLERTIRHYITSQQPYTDMHKLEAGRAALAE